MSALQGLQSRLQNFILHADPAVIAEVAGDAVTDARRRLAIYHDAYRSRLAEALGTDFTTLPVLMGESACAQMLQAYITATPSTHRNLRWYGQDLPAFLRAAGTDVAAPWLAEVAEFEWAVTLSFDAADESSLTFAQLAALPPEQWPMVRFRLHPSVRHLRLRTNAPALRQAVDAGESVPVPETLPEAVDWLMWRKDLVVLYRSLTPEESWALQAAQAGADFTALCEGLCRWADADSAAARLAGMLRAWVDDQLIVAAGAPSD